uniref:Uncharacterized protein n=1 Tax=Tetradesmus obliquus TaxID=3088 RepID=A0A383VXK8_TETOB|eukprot:jgi/Sobl393_1/15316/SZX69156.1
MDRSRRERNQSDDKQNTSQLIQQLAAQRQRKLDAAAARPHSASAQAALLPLPDSDSDHYDDEAQQQRSSSTAAGQAGSGKQGRSRLIRRDAAASQQQQQEQLEDETDELAGMLQGFGLSSSTNSSSNASRADVTSRQPAAAAASSIGSTTADRGRKAAPHLDLSAASSDSESDSIDASEVEGAAAAAAAAAASDSEEADATEDDDAASDDETDEIEDASSKDSNSNSSNGDDDDEELAVVPRSRKPLQTTVQPAATAAGRAVHRTSAAAAAAASSSDEASGSDDDASASSGSGADDAEETAQQQPDAAAAAAASAGSLVLEGGFCLEAKVAAKLYPHQVHGVKWLWSLHRMRKGGILADDMGLGKTMQCSAFLAGALQRSRHGNAYDKPSSSSSSSSSSSGAIRAMIVAPKTLLSHWEKELRVCGMGPRSHCFYGSSEGERAAALRAVTGRGGVLLTTYGMVLHNAAQLRAGLGTAARDADEAEDEEDPFSLSPPEGRRILWDYIILDEGHKVKNARTQLAQRLRELRAVCRVIISGTPVQNNLAELHALLDFAVPGLLGGPREFKSAFEKPIAAGQDRSAGLRVRELGAAKAAELRRIVAPFMLRREKKEVFGSGSSSSAAGAGSSSSGGGSGTVVAAASAASSSSGSSAGAVAAGSTTVGGSAVPAMMGTKHDLVIWLRLQPLQRHIYEAFLHSDAVKAALNSSKSPLAALTVLKKVCDHPALLSERATKLVLTASRRGQQGKSKHSSKGSKQRGSSMDDFIVDDDDDENDGYDSVSDSGSGDAAGSGSESDNGSSGSGGGFNSKAARSRAAVAASLDDAGFSEEFMTWAAAEGLQDRLLEGIRTKGPEASCKALFVADLLKGLVAGGHRTLVFSQSRVMLDILQAAVVARGWSFCRIDGSMASTDARQVEVERFQAAGSSIPVFLLTTQVGGLGLTLTAANRVVIVDPSWNPATDNQSVDRAYRIGQSRDVVVYRLVTCGTVEEKIYRKQVFKGGLSRAGMEEGVQLRYFTHQELHELFKWDPAALRTSETQQLLTQQHSRSAELAAISSHVAWLEAHALCAGTSEHGMLFSHQDPEGKHLQLDPKHLNPNHVPGSAAAAAAGLGISGYGRGGSRPVAGAGAGAAGPSAAELSNMMSSLNIASSSNRGGAAAAAAAAGNGAAGGSPHHHQQQQQQLKQQQQERLQAEVQHLQYQLGRVSTDLATVGPRLPDGGSKLKARQLELQDALEAAQQQLQQLQPQHPQQQQQQQLGQAAAAAAGVVVEPRSHALADITNSEHSWDEQQQQGAAVCQPLRAPALDLQPSSAGGSRLAAGHQQPQAGSAAAAAAAAGYGFPGSSQWQQQRVPPPPPPPRPPQQQQQQQQQRYPPLPPPPQAAQRQEERQPPPPPPPPPQQQQQQQGFKQSSSSSGSRNSSSSASQAAATDRQAPPGVTTLDGRVPTMSQLQQRKHVLKKALQAGDKLKEQLRLQGQRLPADKQQQWAAMYAEYKEIKAALALAQAQQQQQVETIDLT